MYSAQPSRMRLGKLRLEPAKLVVDNARRCNDPVRRAISRTTWLRWSTVRTPSCIALGGASKALVSGQAWGRQGQGEGTCALFRMRLGEHASCAIRLVHQSMASRATPSERTRERESMTAWLWCVMLMDMGLRGAKIGSSSNGSPSTCGGVQSGWRAKSEGKGARASERGGVVPNPGAGGSGGAHRACRRRGPRESHACDASVMGIGCTVRCGCTHRVDPPAAAAACCWRT